MRRDKLSDATQDRYRPLDVLISKAGGQFAAHAMDISPKGWNAVAYSINAVQVNPELIADVIARSYNALLPGGDMLQDDKSGPVDAAMWGLAEALNGGGGKAHTIAQCRRFFLDAGFVDIADTEFVAGTLHRVTGFKAG